ncbi:hypothetical protein [Amphritea sp.]|uniref:hypothetical protein n=1 Tax=Amphritea sp. TaxID=1872502 RepID=UPI003566BE15
MSDSDVPSRRLRYTKLGLIIGIIVSLYFGGSWLAQQLNFQVFPRHDSMLTTVVLGTAVVYILLMATPFMPGIELGLMLLMMLGSKGALLVYLCTLTALMISFIVGRSLSPRLIYRFLRWLHLSRASALVLRLEPLNPQERLQLLRQNLPAYLAPVLVNYRYLTIAVLLNLPGNALVGGGGGIGLVAGMSGMIKLPGFFLLVAVAVAPVPLWFFLFGA